MAINIGYDISALGMSYNTLRARAGIFRYVESLAYGLAMWRECQLLFSALESWMILGALEYLQAHAGLREIPVLPPQRSLANRALKFFNRNVHNLNVRISDPQTDGLSRLGLKALRRPQYEAFNLLTRQPAKFDVSKLCSLDIFHSPYFALPEINCPNWRQPKRFLTVYDLIPILYPHFFEKPNQHGFPRILNSLTPEDWVLTISESTKNDLCNYLNFDPQRVFVTYLAASSEIFHPCKESGERAAIKRRYKIPATPYLLSVNTLEPRKNMGHAIRSFVRLVKQEHLDLNFVLVGHQGWKYDEIFNAIAEAGELKDRIILTGYVADADLAAIYSDALAFVYPSIYEGFGLPPLEAMQCGAPVITSNTSSLPEVVGDAAILVDPQNMDELCQAILQLYQRPAWRAELSKQSLARAQQFSWQRCVQQTINAYQVALAN